MIARRPRQRGFTLLELLVAITLLGVLMAALFGALRLGARVWETGEARLDASVRVQVVQDFLRRQLGQTVPLADLTAGRGSSPMLFAGESDGLRFVSLLPAHLGGGASLMELALRPPAADRAPGDLVLRVRPLEPTGAGAPAGASEVRVLLEAVESLEIAYFGADRPGATPTWWHAWQGQRTLPSLVRVRIGLPQGDRRRWPELIVGLMVDLPPPFQL